MTLPLTRKGFTLVEVMMVIALTAILALVVVEFTGDTVNESKYQETILKMNRIRNAMIGDPSMTAAGRRTSFGYLGDMGAIPDDLLGIVANPGATVYALDATSRIGVGWNGPYLAPPNSFSFENWNLIPSAHAITAAELYFLDAWGNPIDYAPADVPPTLISKGANGAVGGTKYNRDIILEMPSSMTVAEVNGYVCMFGGPYAEDVEVELNVPDGVGVLAHPIQTLVAADAGKFSFSNVPHGIRSITAYAPDKATATAGSTIGPVIISVDRPNYMVSCELLDFGFLAMSAAGGSLGSIFNAAGVGATPTPTP